MPKVKNDGTLSGHMSGIVYRGINGRQVIQAMPSQYHDRNSQKQQKQRSGMRNILAIYRVLKNLLKEQFEDEGDGKSAYNCFLHHNLLLPAVELSKEDYEEGLCITAPYMVSFGTLPPLEVEAVGNTIQFQMKSDEWKKGDILRLIKVSSKNEVAGVPTQISAHCSEVFFDKALDKPVVSEPLPHGAYTYIHIRKKTHGQQVSTQQLVLI